MLHGGHGSPLPRTVGWPCSGTRVTVFAGQRNDPFFVDIGSIFDLADLRPFQEAHLLPMPATGGVDTLSTVNVHTIAIRVPISELTHDGSVPTNVMSSRSVLGIWGAASRRGSVQRPGSGSRSCGC